MLREKSRRGIILYRVFGHFQWCSSRQGPETLLSGSAGKLTIPFTVPHWSQQYAGNKIATADLIARKGKFWLHVVVSVPEPVLPKGTDVIGVDLGLNRPTVTSARQFLGGEYLRRVLAALNGCSGELTLRMAGHSSHILKHTRRDVL